MRIFSLFCILSLWQSPIFVCWNIDLISYPIVSKKRFAHTIHPYTIQHGWMLELAQKYYKNARDDDVNDMEEREYEGNRWLPMKRITIRKEKRYQDNVKTPKSTFITDYRRGKSFSHFIVRERSAREMGKLGVNSLQRLFNYLLSMKWLTSKSSMNRIEQTKHEHEQRNNNNNCRVRLRAIIIPYSMDRANGLWVRIAHFIRCRFQNHFLDDVVFGARAHYGNPTQVHHTDYDLSVQRSQYFHCDLCVENIFANFCQTNLCRLTSDSVFSSSPSLASLFSFRWNIERP